MFNYVTLDRERYYNRIHLIFLHENKNVKSFDVYRPAWEYLKDTPKFISITTANNAASRAVSSLSSTDASPATELITPQQSLQKRPIGKKSAKRMEDEVKIINTVTDKLKDTISTNIIANGSGNVTATIISHAFQALSSTIAQGFQSWNERQAYNNASPTLKRQYDNLMLRSRIRELQRQTSIITEDDFTLAPSSMPVTVERPSVDDDEDDLTQSQFN